MAEPVPFPPEAEAYLSSLIGVSREGTIQADRCVMCPCEAKEFNDDESFQEYRRCGLCQHCQDRVFGPDPGPRPLPQMNPPI